MNGVKRKNMEEQRKNKGVHLYEMRMIKGSLEVLTSDYTESCRQVLQRRCET